MLDYLKETKDVGCFTSLSTLMSNCTVLDLDTFERCTKAELLGRLKTCLIINVYEFLFSIVRCCRRRHGR